MESNEEEIKSEDDLLSSFKLLTGEEISALPKEELAQYLTSCMGTNRERNRMTLFREMPSLQTHTRHSGRVEVNIE